ncbi:MAG: thymidine kinase [Victivallales bacterium]|nr:thymidine kinase [Victivallales bacterium]MCF7889017.1 thymidine kinase [Victivallales bacterium]
MNVPGKVYFKYGVMGSSKSFDLIRAEFNYRERGMDTFVLTQASDTRNRKVVKSRIGVSVDAYAVTDSDNIYDIVRRKMDEEKKQLRVVFVDEIHFFTPEQIDQLTDVSDYLFLPVICYGLRSDFKSRMFPGSKRLLEVADEIEEIKAMCECGRKATFNARFVNGRPALGGKQIQVGDQEYKSFCRKCYKKLYRDIRES